MTETIKELNHELTVLNSELKFSKDSLKRHTDKRTISYINLDIVRKKKEIEDWKLIIANEKLKNKKS